MSSDVPAVSVLRPVPMTSQEQFVAALRRLREHSGLTFKQIERVTSAHGPTVLPASTLATALQRRTVPRAEVVAALVSACGGGPEVVAEWLAVRSGLIHPMDTGASITIGAAPTPPRWWSKACVLAGLAVLLCATAISATATSRTPPLPSIGEAVHDPDVVLPASLPAVGGYLLLLGGLCLSEKGARDRSGLIYLRPCDRSFPERRLMPYEGELWRVTIVHPEFGAGCMGVVSASTLAGAAMSDDNCDRVQTERFTLRRVPGGYQLLPEGGDLCVGTLGAPRKDAQVLQLPCDPHAHGQVFSIRSFE